MSQRKNKTINYQPENLFVLDGQEEEQTPFQWDQMPEFDQPEAEAWKVLKVRFDGPEDLEKFADAIGQTVTHKTKSIRYPAVDKNANSLLRWIHEDDMDNHDIQEVIE